MVTTGGPTNALAEQIPPSTPASLRTINPNVGGRAVGKTSSNELRPEKAVSKSIASELSECIRSNIPKSKTKKNITPIPEASEKHDSEEDDSEEEDSEDEDEDKKIGELLKSSTSTKPHGPLHGLTGAKAKFEWKQTHEDAFQLLKQKISKAPYMMEEVGDNHFVTSPEKSFEVNKPEANAHEEVMDKIDLPLREVGRVIQGMSILHLRIARGRICALSAAIDMEA
ncbi:46 kDa FK506-binding nuclear protein-like [Papaver somniferum]|uniref:46 kDa FK506-binding nuclear protein-like n=1 Tax=Papaver somniferum TaxID=3469 RepID=UPI000E6FFF85|nr:46 kDa FK506-binding nuclear protein-like [Papaver somniferum]